jgi:hypothetical protein
MTVEWTNKGDGSGVWEKGGKGMEEQGRGNYLIKKASAIVLLFLH